jgi:hypothetical protein
VDASPSSDRLEQALSVRDWVLTKDLLSVASQLRASVVDAFHDSVDTMTLAVFDGRFSQARSVLTSLTVASSPRRARAFHEAFSQLQTKLPPDDSPASVSLSEATRELLSSASGDPFRTQERLSRLIHGMDDHVLPDSLVRARDRLAYEASGLVRERGLARRGRDLGPVQENNECWLRAIYDLPVSALDGLRRALSFEAFLARVQKRFPAHDVKKFGLRVEDFPHLLEALGLNMVLHPNPNALEIEMLLNDHGALIVLMGWFDKSARQMEMGRAWLHYHQHVVIVCGTEGPREAREFVVRDSLLTHEIRYTAAELGLLRARFHSVESGGECGDERLRTFVG